MPLACSGSTRPMARISAWSGVSRAMWTPSEAEARSLRRPHLFVVAAGSASGQRAKHGRQSHPASQRSTGAVDQHLRREDTLPTYREITDKRDPLAGWSGSSPCRASPATPARRRSSGIDGPHYERLRHLPARAALRRADGYRGCLSGGGRGPVACRAGEPVWWPAAVRRWTRSRSRASPPGRKPCAFLRPPRPRQRLLPAGRASPVGDRGWSRRLSCRRST
jgi:hypothetical protein